MKKKLKRKFREVAPILFNAIRNYRLDKRRDAPFSTHPDGFRFKGNQAMERGLFEQEEVDFFKRVIVDMDSFVNIGANIGYYTCLASNSGVPTIAFEPIPENAAFLYENVAINGWKSVEIFPLALGDQVGVLPMFGTGTGASFVEGWANISSSDRRFIPVNTLDNVLAGRLENQKILFWVDVEGFELEVLAGAGNIIDENPDSIWVIEICIDEHFPGGRKINPRLSETFAIFFERNYLCYAIGSEVCQVEEETVKQISLTGKNSLKTHNFCFTKTSIV